MSVEGGTKLLHKQIRTPGTATSNVPLSQAIKVGPTLYISGNLGLDMQTRKFVGPDIESQTRQTLLNMQAVLKEAGMTFKNVVKTTVLLADINDFARANAVYSTFFEPPYPARSAYQVANLPLSARIEIEAIALD